MSTPWNKGHTKETHPSLKKTSETLKSKEIDNFATWRAKKKEMGEIPKEYLSFEPDGDLAELIGVIHGDGHIYKFPRTQSLSIFANTKNQGFVNRYSRIIEKIFDKTPKCTPHGNENCTRIRVYQKYISERLGIPCGAQKEKVFIPVWILSNRENKLRYLRGLYEAEGNLSEHQPTYTHKFMFTNVNQSLLDVVEDFLNDLDFHPHRTEKKIQISRKAEVYKAVEMIGFRDYNEVR
jgi:DNA-binding transcriptional regulator WhiA